MLTGNVRSVSFCALQVWYRVIQIVVNREDVQGYAAKTVFEVCLTLMLITSRSISGSLIYPFHSFSDSLIEFTISFYLLIFL